MLYNIDQHGIKERFEHHLMLADQWVCLSVYQVMIPYMTCCLWYVSWGIDGITYHCCSCRLHFLVNHVYFPWPHFHCWNIHNSCMKGYDPPCKLLSGDSINTCLSLGTMNDVYSTHPCHLEFHWVLPMAIAHWIPLLPLVVQQPDEEAASSGNKISAIMLDMSLSIKVWNNIIHIGQLRQCKVRHFIKETIIV